MRNPDNRRLSGRRARSLSTHSLQGVWVAILACAAIALAGCGDSSTEVNQAPVLTLDVGAQESYVIGDRIQIRANAHDPDGDPLTFSVEGLPERANLQTFPNSALMSWDPINSDVTAGSEGRKLIFVVEDDRGGRSERVVHLTIVAGNGAPVFESPSSKLFNPRSGQTLTFEVKVRDDDSNEVDLSMPDETAPEGATFQQTDQKMGTFSWTPTAVQLTQRVHSTTFIANDNQGAPVKQKVTIILQSSTGGDDPTSPTPEESACDEQPIRHASPGPQRTVEDYELEAYLSPDSAAKYDEAVVFWATDNPMKYDVDMESVDMKVSGDWLRAGIPNLLLAPGESKTVYYIICAMASTANGNGDDDDFICAPASYYYSFVAYSPDSNFCADDSDSGISFSNAPEVSPTAWEDYRTCEGAADFHKVSLPAGGQAEVYITYSLTEASDSQTPIHPMKINVYNDDYDELEDKALVSECSGIVYIDLQSGSSASTWYIEVEPSGEMPYQMTAFHSGGEEEDPVVTCEDNDQFGSTNRDPDSAGFVDDREYTGLTVCGGESEADWYANLLGAGEYVFVELDVQQGAALSDIYFAAYGPGGGIIAMGTEEDGKLYLEFETTVEDFYYYIIEAPIETHYSISFVSG